MHRNRLLLRVLLLGIPFLQQFAAYVLPTTRAINSHAGLKSTSSSGSRNQLCILAARQQTSPQDDDDDDDDSPNESPSTVSSYSYNPMDAPAESYEMRQQPQQQDPFQAGFQDAGEKELMKTLGGGTALMFEMVRKRMLDWGQAVAVAEKQKEQPPKPKALPRWHPHSGISDVNPNFRNQAPAMNNRGFAESIWRNVRKRNKPTLWLNALRTYDRMAILEDDNLKIQRSNTHHEGAMLACAKLGSWQRALEIYHYVYHLEQDSQAQFDESSQFNQTKSSTQPSSPKTSKQKLAVSVKSKIRRQVHVTDNMILSLVRACVRASRQRSRNKGEQLSPELEEQEAALRRIPLDTAVEVLSTIQENHNSLLVSQHINPLAAAYQSLGYIQRANDIVQTMLSNRTAGEEPEYGEDILNVFDLCAKDKHSYSLLVQGAVATGDWGAAVEALTDMTKSGLYPNERHCNTWSEISERQTRPRAAGSWKKKREDYWTDSVR